MEGGKYATAKRKTEKKGGVVRRHKTKKEPHESCRGQNKKGEKSRVLWRLGWTSARGLISSGRVFTALQPNTCECGFRGGTPPKT